MTKFRALLLASMLIVLPLATNAATPSSGSAVQPTLVQRAVSAVLVLPRMEVGAVKWFTGRSDVGLSDSINNNALGGDALDPLTWLLNLALGGVYVGYRVSKSSLKQSSEVQRRKSTGIMSCTRCGSEVEKKAPWCGKCGKPIVQDEKHDGPSVT